MPRARRLPVGKSFDKIVLSCEHGGNDIPIQFAKIFAGKKSVLKTHRGIDIGALDVAEALSQSLGIPLFSVTVSRLLIDLNRSRHHPRLFSEFTRHLSQEKQTEIIRDYYEPHRSSVERWIKGQVSRGHRVLHIGVHSFTPVLNGDERNADIGILYDPKRLPERTVANELVGAIKTQVELAPHQWRVRKNYPYHGAADGFTTALRRQFDQRDYSGIELELNQALVRTASGRRHMIGLLSQAIKLMAQSS
ncbi:MAG: hypothetical protein RL011_1730 [Pseudomonadota bacterium]|jgi:predicted N-formylglutamate amidohydrolase